MLRRPGALIAIATVLVGATTVRSQMLRDNRLFRSGTELTTLTATVRDADDHLVVGLPADAFEVYEDGARQQVTQFTHERVPIGLGVLIDSSDSMFGVRMADAQQAVTSFLFELLNPSDEFFIVAFNHQPHVLTRWTNQPAIIGRALASLKPSGATALYDAILASLPLMEQSARTRTALVIISDGADTASTSSLRDVRSALMRTDVFAYAIAIDSPNRHAINASINPTALREITDDRGGRTEIVHNSAELVSATARIAEELNSQYVLGYLSPGNADGRYHSIRVRVPGFKVRSRTGYVPSGAAPRPRVPGAN